MRWRAPGPRAADPHPACSGSGVPRWSTEHTLPPRPCADRVGDSDGPARFTRARTGHAALYVHVIAQGRRLVTSWCRAVLPEGQRSPWLLTPESAGGVPGRVTLAVEDAPPRRSRIVAFPYCALIRWRR